MKKRPSKSKALAILQKYCAYQDRCHQEVRSKLLNLQVYGDDLEEIMAELITENFLNEERFARSFARGKFRLKHWGRQKIERELKLRNISDYCRRKAFEEIEDDDYSAALRKLTLKKALQVRAVDTFIKRRKIAQYLINKGYEPPLVWSVVKELVPDHEPPAASDDHHNMEG